MKKELSVIILGLLILSGCTGISGGADSYTSEYIENLERLPAASPEEECKVGACACMLCEKGPSILGLDFDDEELPHFLSSFVGGRCVFDYECNTTRFQEHANKESALSSEGYVLRQFMIGQGPSFADFGTANEWCNDGLSMAVHWLIGSSTREYDLPDAGRAICMLDKGVLPVYVLYSRGENINVSRTREAARILATGSADVTGDYWTGPVGPVIITTELEFNGSNATQVSLVADQIDVINEECNDVLAEEIYCMVAVAPRIGDEEALDAVIQEVERRHGEGEYTKYIHLVAFGINSHYVEGDCNAGRMIEDARSFATYAKNEKKLPSVIPYILVDAEGDPDNILRCRESDVAETYNYVFNHGIKSLAKAGVIGLSLYTTYGDYYANPLLCGDCKTIAMDPAAEPIVYYRQRAWFGNCQKYHGHAETDDTGAVTDVVTSTDVPIRFPSEEAGICDTGESSVDSIFGVLAPDYAGQLKDIADPPTPELHDPIESLWRCDSCITEKENIVELFPILAGRDCPPGQSCSDYVERGAVGAEQACTQHPQKDYFASRYNVDPILVRSFMQGDEPCAVARVCRPGIAHGSAGNCFQVGEEIYNRGFNVLVDPEGNCEYQDLSAPLDEGGQNTERPTYRYFAWGIGQILESPYTYWPYNEDEPYNPDEIDGIFIDEWERARSFGRPDAIATSKSCAPPDGYFNPFNETHSICVAVAKLSRYTEIGISTAEAHNLGQGDYYKNRIIGAFIAAYKALGIWDAPSVSALNCGSRTLGNCLIDEYEEHAVTENDGECEGDASSGCAPINKCELNIAGTGCVAIEDECYFETAGDEGKDFLWFTHCYLQYHDVTEEGYRGHFTGFRKLGNYAYLVEYCEDSYCPSWKKLADIYEELGGSLDEFNREDPFARLGE